MAEIKPYASTAIRCLRLLTSLPASEQRYYLTLDSSATGNRRL